MPLWQHRAVLERLYRDLNRPMYVHGDPLGFLYNYQAAGDRG